MNSDQFLRHFDTIVDTPDATLRLRRFILDLAVRGKLVPQVAGEQLSQDMRSRTLNGEHKSGAFDLPSSWAWVEVGSVAETRLGKMLDKAKNRGFPRPYLRNLNVRWFDFDLSDLSEMPFEESELAEFKLLCGDVLICEGGEPGRAAVWDERAEGIYFQKAIHRVRFVSDVDPYFFVNALKASADDGRLAESFTGTGIKHFTGRSLSTYRFPVAPIAEQRRIVARIDQLMTLCAQLEDRLSSAQSVRSKLLEAYLSGALATSSDANSEAA